MTPVAANLTVDSPPPCSQAAGTRPDNGLDAASGGEIAATTVGPRGSYLDIISAALLVGGSSLANVVIGMLRNKAMALLIGPAGIGLMGTLSSVADLARSLAQLGLQASGVRQIAAAAASGDNTDLAHTAAVVRRISLACGLLGALVLLATSGLVGRLTFGDDSHHLTMALLAPVVCCGVVAGGFGALVQGLRRIADLARMSVWTTLAGCLVSVPLVALWQTDGIVPALIASAALALLIARHYGRRAMHASALIEPTLSRAELLGSASSLLRLGLAFLASGLLAMAVAYGVRLMLVRQLGLDAAGVYQAATTLAGLYVGFILQALGSDFYPRLVGVAHDHAACNRVVNEQTHVSVLLAGPGVIATLTFAQPAVAWFYSAEFAGAVDTLRWTTLGMALRVVTWPMGYIIVAQNRQVLFLAVELAWAMVVLALTWPAVARFGAPGAGLAFFASYVFQLGLIWPLVWRTSGLRWSRANLGAAAVYLAAIGCVFTGQRWLDAAPAMWLGTACLLLTTLHGARGLARLVDGPTLPAPLRRWTTGRPA